MTTKDIKTIVILVELTNGKTHQVVASDEVKQNIIDELARVTGSLKIYENGIKWKSTK